MASATLVDGVLEYRSKYSPHLVDQLKTSIPASARKWDNRRRLWLVSPTHGLILKRITLNCLGEHLVLPDLTQAIGKAKIELLNVTYIGRTKDRGDGTRSAFGFVNGEWRVVFPEPVLKSWFGIGINGKEQNGKEQVDKQTLYTTLGLKKTCAGADVRKSYRRLALQWHPDKCSEPDAAQQFIAIQSAYDMLSNPKSRAKYDAGLALEATLTKRDWQKKVFLTINVGYRSPLRCGYIMCKGTESLGRFNVESILEWLDIIKDDKTLVTSWPMGATEPEERWV